MKLRAILPLIVVLMLSFGARTTNADPLLPGSKGAEEKEEPGPLPERPPQDPEPEVEPEPAPPTKSVEPEPAAPVTTQPVQKRPSRGSFDGMMQIGLGAVSMPGTDTVSGFAPGILLGHRSAFLMSGQFGFRWSTRMFIHDFEIIGDYYGWYNKGTDDEVTEKYLLLWPGLLFGPFIGANYGTGFGFVTYFSESNPSLYFDAGFGFDMWLNPSDECFIIDVGLSAEATLGFDFNEFFGMGFTASWGFPFFHGLFDGESSDIPMFLLYFSVL